MSVTVAGNVGREPELKFTQNGDPICSFSLATNREYTDGAGQRQKETTWLKVSVFGKQAEVVNRFVHKGRQVLVEGRLRVDPKTGGPVIYKKSDGTAGANFELLANVVRFIGAPEKTSGAEGGEIEGGETVPF